MRKVWSIERVRNVVGKVLRKNKMWGAPHRDGIYNI